MWAFSAFLKGFPKTMLPWTKFEMSDLSLKKCAAMQEKYRGPRGSAVSLAMFAVPCQTSRDFLDKAHSLLVISS